MSLSPKFMLRSSRITTVAFRGGGSSSDSTFAMIKGDRSVSKDAAIRAGRRGDDCRGGELTCMLEGPPFSVFEASERLTAPGRRQDRTTGTST